MFINIMLHVHILIVFILYIRSSTLAGEWGSSGLERGGKTLGGEWGSSGLERSRSVLLMSCASRIRAVASCDFRRAPVVH